MHSPPRILFPSLSAKIGLYEKVLAQARQFNPNSKVIGTDSDPECFAAKLVEEFRLMPLIDHLSDTQLKKYLEELGITHVLPTRDQELGYWSERAKLLQQCGVKVWISRSNFIKACSDKFQFYKTWKHSAISPIETKLSIEDENSGQWVVKEKYGAGACNIGLDLSVSEAEKCAYLLKNPIFQPFIRGKEFTAETWVSKQGRCHGIVLRWRNRVVEGESHETTVFTHPKWEQAMQDVFLHVKGAHGHILAQVLVDKEEQLHLVEINPRLGGASPLSLSAGLSSIAWHLMEENDNCSQIPLSPPIRNGMKLIKERSIQWISA